MRNFLSLLLLITLAALASSRAFAQTPSPTASPPVLKGGQTSGQSSAPPAQTDTNLPREVGEDEVVKVDTSLVTIPVTVVDAAGNYVTDLRQEDFRVYEDGVEQKLALFNQTTQPVCVVLLIDASGSVMSSLTDIKRAAIAFTDQLQPTDYVFPIIFSGSIIPLLPQATNDRAALRKAIQGIDIIKEDASSIYDAVQTVNDRILKRIRGRRALILFTDGEDVSSRRATKKSTLADAQELDALIYTVQYPGAIAMNTDRTVNSPPPSGAPEKYLKRLAAITGGKYYRGDSSKNIAKALASIAEELRRQYILGYYAGAPLKQGQGRRLKVAVNRENMSARTSKAYIDIR
jgi:Ca-activated chloride channel family protein